jgi:hypothetical protein
VWIIISSLSMQLDGEINLPLFFNKYRIFLKYRILSEPLSCTAVFYSTVTFAFVFYFLVCVCVCDAADGTAWVQDLAGQVQETSHRKVACVLFFLSCAHSSPYQDCNVLKPG